MGIIEKIMACIFAGLVIVSAIVVATGVAADVPGPEITEAVTKIWLFGAVGFGIGLLAGR